MNSSFAPFGPRKRNSLMMSPEGGVQVGIGDSIERLGGRAAAFVDSELAARTVGGAFSVTMSAARDADQFAVPATAIQTTPTQMSITLRALMSFECREATLVRIDRGMFAPPLRNRVLV